MKVDNLVGKTMKELAETTGVFWNIVHVFVANDDDDQTGTRLMDTYNLKQVVLAFPAAADATVISAKEICRETFLFIKPLKEDPTE